MLTVDIAGQRSYWKP